MTRNKSNNQSCHANIFPRNLFKILDKYGAQKIAFGEGGEIHGSEPSRHAGKAPKEREGEEGRPWMSSRVEVADPRVNFRGREFGWGRRET